MDVVAYDKPARLVVEVERQSEVSAADLRFRSPRYARLLPWVDDGADEGPSEGNGPRYVANGEIPMDGPVAIGFRDHAGAPVGHIGKLLDVKEPLAPQILVTLGKTGVDALGVDGHVQRRLQ